ncbi:hypothetical protein AtubIFM56815_002077 [Aspergillus tubingensis]|uniref:Amidase domain-containing protein n=1 Tax=Aspergillus tubingensis TaxID=5068 RepID=A0A9W6AVD4_ASPTU|nr:hypothetical protein AtubIFM56815_002077 [Aspergillus tubingensis]
MDWQAVCKEAQASVLNAIPVQWRLNLDDYHGRKDISKVPFTCGILTKEQIQITELTATEIVDRLESRTLKAAQVNCLTEWFYEEGLEQARALDDAIARGETLKGPLHGVPVALKDVHELKDHVSTMGYVSRRNNTMKEDSALVQTLRAAGAVFFCKTTMPQSGMTLETVSNLWGRTTDPFNRDLVAGGSSGGDAVLVALKGSPIAPSTDMGGSIRCQRHLMGCMVSGLLPTAYLKVVCVTLTLVTSRSNSLAAQIFNPRERSAAEALNLNLKTRALKERFAESWDGTASRTASGRVIDALVMPSSPAVGYPHDFNIYLGYTSLLNLIDYPSVILAITNFRVDTQLDPMDHSYQPLKTNPYDRPNYELYRPESFTNQPSTIQIVGRPFKDEEAIRAAFILDDLFKGQ